jgi:hypothetical protein
MSMTFLSKKNSGSCIAKDLEIYLSLQIPSKKFKITERDVKELTPLASSQRLPRWAWGPLSVPYRLGTYNNTCY